LDSKLFDVRDQYTIYQHQEGLGIKFYTNSGNQPNVFLFLDKELRQGKVFFPREIEAEQNSDQLKKPGRTIVLNPFSSSLDQLLLINYLAKGRGVVLHSAGLAVGGRGWLFVGTSGAGKTTLTRLWEPTAAEVLSNDRIIVRRKLGDFWIYGTPWHSDTEVGSPKNAPLEKIFFLAQRPRNSLRQLTLMEAVSRLFVCCFPPFYDKEGMAFVLDFISQITAEVPCYELGFVPDSSAIDFIRGLA